MYFPLKSCIQIIENHWYEPISVTVFLQTVGILIHINGTINGFHLNTTNIHFVDSINFNIM
jgi:hypothetical protein